SEKISARRAQFVPQRPFPPAEEENKKKKKKAISYKRREPDRQRENNTREPPTMTSRCNNRAHARLYRAWSFEPSGAQACRQPHRELQQSRRAVLQPKGIPKHKAPSRLSRGLRSQA